MEGLEVFMQGLPLSLNDQGLRTQLTSVIKGELRIDDWDCQKSRGKNFGTVTFLYRVQGERFLQVYGETRKIGQRVQANLKILGSWVKCKKSKNTPNSFLLKAIVKRAEDARLKKEESEGDDDEDEESPAKDHKVNFELRGFSCGHYDYPDGRLDYIPDIEWFVRGLVRFARDSLVILYGSIRIEIPYRTVHEIVVGGRPTSLTFTLWETPRFFQVNAIHQDIADLMNGMGISAPATGVNKITRTRLTELPHSGASHAAIMGQALVYSVLVSPADFNPRIQRLKQKEKLNIQYYDFPNILPGRTYLADGLRRIESLLEEYSTASNIPFDVLFQFQALVHNGYLLPQTVETLLIRLFQAARTPPSNGFSGGKAHGSNGAEGVKKNFPISANAVKKLFSQIPFPGPDVEASTFSPKEIWSFLEANEREIRHGALKEFISEKARESLVMVYKVQVTPTRVTLLGPEPEAKNRILRKFPNHIGYFARVQFCEEDGQDLFFNIKVSLERIWERFRHILLRGVRIVGREYMFLGFSHSSLRAHSVWLMAPFFDDHNTLQTYFTVISHLGKFTQIQSPSKCAARIGQAFSETPFSVSLRDLRVDVQIVDDVKSKDGSRVFSDGVGTLSRELMEAIHDSLPQNRENTTCFQIRWGGAKGMLCLDDTIPGMVMRVRPSMVKFESEDIHNLEICDMGNRPIPLVLNRQMIKILEDMLVADEWFFQVQNRELERLRMITAQIHNTVTFLKRQKVAEQINFSKFIRRLHRLGIDYKKDEFLCSVVETVVLRELRLLKHKARIPVENGMTLFGVMDEFKFLEEDEIYVTFEKEKGKKRYNTNLRDRLVLVTRSPALHPGDIQIRRAVEPPKDHPLRSLTNCVVFSQKGDRDLPSQLSGGDLDGDIYNIIWDDLAVDSAQLEFPPADYPLVTPLNINRAVTRDDMTNFFVEFMATDQLGVIATKHLILADMKPAGTVDAECKLLAEMHSTGVDYSKSGIPIDINKLRGLTRTSFRPEFLAPVPPANIVNRTEIVFENLKSQVPDDEDDEGGPSHKYYKSEKILGRLYRAIDEKKIWRQDIHQVVSRHGMSVWEQLLQHINRKCRELGGVNWQAASDDARRIRDAYDDAVWSATMDYSDNFTKGLTELEVFTGYIFNKSGAQTRRQRDRSVRLKDEYDRIAKWIEGLIRKKEVHSRDADDYHSDSGDLSDDDVPTYKPNGTHAERNVTPLELSIACLNVGTAKSNSFGRNKEKFESFKVIAAQCALTELELAIQQHEYEVGSALTAASAREILARRPAA